MRTCPKCNQGAIRIQRYLQKEPIFLCDECESMWTDKNNTSRDIAIYFCEYLENLGLDHNEVSYALYKKFKESGFKIEYLE